MVTPYSFGGALRTLCGGWRTMLRHYIEGKVFSVAHFT